MRAMHRVVVSGATGMIGSALVRVCLSRNYEVVALVRDSSPRIGNLPDDARLLLVEYALEDIKELDAGCIGDADVFFHLAWSGTGVASRNNARLQLENVSSTLDAVQLASRLGCSVFVGAGSQAEYGLVNEVLKPSTACNPESAYGIAKLCAGHMARLECAKLGIRCEWARILSVYGPADVPNSLVMSVINSCLAGKSPKCTLGEQVWDYLYCDDCAKALLAMAEKGMDGAVYTVGSGQSRLLKDYINEICAIVNENVSAEFGAIPYYKNQAMYLYADITFLHEQTGWMPIIPFSDGIRKTVNWCKDNQ